MTSAPTGALLDTCFRQVEYAGVLAGAKNPAGGAEGRSTSCCRKQFQAGVPGADVRLPGGHSGTPLPADWQKYAPVAPHPATLDPATIAANREAWTPVGRSDGAGDPAEVTVASTDLGADPPVTAGRRRR